jgi:hypothetical protein
LCSQSRTQALYLAQNFVITFTKALYLSLSLARSMQFIPLHLIYPRSISILFTRLSLGLPSGFFLFGFLLAFLFAHSCCMACLSHLHCLDNSNYTWSILLVYVNLKINCLFHKPTITLRLNK